MTTNTFLCVDAMHEEAMARCGLHDFGETSYREGLGVLVEATRAHERSAELAPRLFECAVQTLTGRLSSQAGWNANPDVVNHRIERPVIITGLPRSGTTILHSLMSVDQKFQWLPRWIGEAPIPRPPREEWETHPQFKAVSARIEALFAKAPKMRAIHDMAPERADECILVMCQSFMSNMFNSILPLPEYRRWWFSADEEPSYRRYRDNLCLIGSREPTKPWLLKNPSHTYGMPEMLRVFPDARVVVLHRNPVETIASGASLTWRNSGLFTKKEAGEARLEIYAKAAQRMERARDDNPEADILDVDYRHLLRDKMDTVRKIYDHLGLVLDEPTERAMVRFIENNPQGKHGSHDYTAEEFGLNNDMIVERFAEYINRHDLG